MFDAFQQDVLSELGLRAYALAPEAGERAAISAAAAAASAVGIAPALLAALARAGDCAPDEVIALPGFAAFGGTPADKRVLWPQLRRLRSRRR